MKYLSESIQKISFLLSQCQMKILIISCKQKQIKLNYPEKTLLGKFLKNTKCQQRSQGVLCGCFHLPHRILGMEFLSTKKKTETNCRQKEFFMSFFHLHNFNTISLNY